MMKADLTKWIDRTETLNGAISPEMAAMAHVTLSTDQDAMPGLGDAAPALWHWTAFNPAPAMVTLADDGHPHTGGFLPPINLPRRMWAGGDVTFHAPVRVGASLRKTSTILNIEEKSETLIFIIVGHEIYEGDTLLITERQDIVYLPIPDRFSPPKARPVPTETTFDVAHPVTTPLLFRYSAITFNAHRIHYDLPYAQGVEKYPGLVIHGPLQATLLLNAAIRHAGRQPSTFSYRGVHPMFHTDPLHLIGYEEGPDSMRLCTGVLGAHQGMQATVSWTNR